MFSLATDSQKTLSTCTKPGNSPLHFLARRGVSATQNRDTRGKQVSCLNLLSNKVSISKIINSHGWTNPSVLQRSSAYTFETQACWCGRKGTRLPGEKLGSATWPGPSRPSNEDRRARQRYPAVTPLLHGREAANRSLCTHSFQEPYTEPNAIYCAPG